MRALFVDQPGPSPVLAVRDVDTPVAGRGDVVIEVAAAGVCGHDIAIMTGLLRRGVDHGVVLGHEVSGTVVQIGDGNVELSEGDHVVASLTAFCGECDRCLSGLDYRCRRGHGIGHALNGGFAQYLRVPARAVTKSPGDIDLTQAALIACPIGVCVRAIETVARARPGQTVLVTGAGGGLGVHAIQVAGAMGVQVFAATSSAEKLDVLENYAPGGVILGGELDFSELVLAFTGDEGADIVIDTVGSAVFGSAIRSLAQYGKMVVIGEVTGGRASVNLTSLMFRDASLAGSTGASLPDIERAIELVGSGSVEPVVHDVLRLEEAERAVAMITNKQAVGRVVLTP